MSVLSGTNLSLGYEGREIVRDLNFEINTKDYLCIVGENGAGKSTFMKTVLGLIEPIRGTITFGDGISKKEIGYLPQQTVVQRDFPASVEEIVQSGCQGRMGIRPFYSKEEKALAKENMERMDVLSYRKRCYRELSGGQQQRVLLARALCATKKVLLLDEPVAGLDPNAMSELYAHIKSLNEEGITILMITHDVATALSYASHVLKIDQSPFFGTKEEYAKYLEKTKILKETEEHG